jgi:universal stress protein A
MILCPLDFSAATRFLFQHALAVAQMEQQELRLLHVQEDQVPPPPAALETHRLLDHYRAAALQAGCRRVSTAVRTGDAAREIVAEAVQGAASVIVLGAHGCTNLTRFLVGSTAELVLRTAPCPTVVISIKPDTQAA